MRDGKDSGIRLQAAGWSEALPEPTSTMDVAMQVLEAAKGLRQMTRLAGQRDLAFLDYLLAMAEDEASKLAERAYH